jgi:hypothetical protein
MKAAQGPNSHGVKAAGGDMNATDMTLELRTGSHFLNPPCSALELAGKTRNRMPLAKIVGTGDPSLATIVVARERGGTIYHGE